MSQTLVTGLVGTILMAIKDAVQYEVETARSEEMTIDQFIELGLQEIESLMHRVVETDVTVLRDASHHILAAGGKRIRPRLVLTSYAACGGRDFHQVAAPASALELVHTASVVHDD